MTYYVNFPDGKVRTPDDLTATAIINDEQQKLRETRDGLHLARAPGGNAVKLTLADVLARDSVILRIRSAKENKTWESASLQLTESFMIVVEGD